MAFIALGFQNAAKSGNNVISDKQADKMFQAYQKKVREEGGQGANSNIDEDGIEEETQENAAETRILEEFI